MIKAKYDFQVRRTGNFVITARPPTDLELRVSRIFGESGTGQELIKEEGLDVTVKINFVR